MANEYTLILLRHGESQWNALNLFTGWVDVDLSEKGQAEAARGGELLKAAGLLPDVLHTSLLRRAIKTAQIALDNCDRHWIPVRRSWRLNERSRRRTIRVTRMWLICRPPSASRTSSPACFPTGRATSWPTSRRARE